MPILEQLPSPVHKDHVSSSFGETWRLPLLCLLLVIAIVYNTFFAFNAPLPDTNENPLLVAELISYLPYLLACVLILSTRAPEGRKRWLELGIILLGAVVLRAQLLGIQPNLSHDSWRYLWDARVTLHGFSPYTYPPGHPLLLHLRNVLYENSRFRNVPTIYPPGAQGFYLLSYLLAPDNLPFLKALFSLCEVISTGLLALLLQRKGCDPARCLIYGWCPVAIVEVALQGHVDALMVMFIMLTLVCAQGTWRGARVVTGLCLALATLTKLYPILLLVVVWRGRRDWWLLITCLLTIVLSYIPYLILGHGQIFGFFASYASEVGSMNGGPLALFMYRLSKQTGWPLQVTYAVDLLLVCSVSLWIWIRRLQERISMEASVLILFCVIFLISSHVFPWYTTVLLPPVALMVGSPWTRASGWSGRALACIGLWYFVCASIVSYFFGTSLNWNLYYTYVYGVTGVFLLLALLLGARNWRIERRSRQRIKYQSLS
ncbi:glycosyltransferase family 87 protein [Dictyobacter aurantiacus]|uniref:DUF2029 domain-containing protein n=1 Tax=Dictyobacter aurantiacus TaxID=1936993 RepID=A0A401ZG71_9CHLR|nr:glycosyltransferase family 87 protein [Dictyobacter aurantiacus]GCE05688.1 hypothetical protein KDAU_30170 [Dictyobacter aurantiacus]